MVSSTPIYADYYTFHISVSEEKEEGYEVSIVFPQTVKGNDYRLFFVENEEVTEIKDGTVDTTGEEGDPEAAGFSFHTDRLGEFVFACTKTYEYQIPEGSLVYEVTKDEPVSLREVLVSSEMVSEEDADLFVTYVTEVTSQDPEAVKVELLNEEECMITPSAMFSETSLTVTMEDGQSGTITVKDTREHQPVEEDGGIEAAVSNPEDEEIESIVIKPAEDKLLPKDAESTAKVVEGSASIEKIAADAEQKKGNPEAVTEYKVFDIDLENVKKEDYNGFHVELTLSEAGAVSGGEYKLYHIKDDGTYEAVPVEVKTRKDEAGNEVADTIVFTTPSFSEFVLAYTVDFHWGDYTYSIDGESEITLSALLEKLNVTEITITDVTDVSFTNPEYIEITKTEPDWVLRSLKTFNTEEKLTLSLKNGKSVEIKVTDESAGESGTWTNGNNGSGTWAVDEDGVLTISGTGAMKDYTTNNKWVSETPWFDYIVKDSTHPNPSVTKIVITGGITRIGTNSFTRTYNLNEIDASDCTSLTTIGGSAFKQQSSGSASNNPNNPKIINFSGCSNLSTIETDAFRDCKKIDSIDISGTKLNASVLTTSGAGFGSSKTAIQTLKANNCTSITGALDLSEYTSLTTLELSGCSGITSLTLPASVTTLDISGCVNLDSLELSACTNLTTVKAGNRSDLTDLSWLTLPSSVTTLDVSGFTSLTSITVPTSVTSLNASGCTGITALDLSSTSLSSIDVSDNHALTALKIPASVNSLNITGCSNVVIYFDGTSSSLPENLIPDSVPLISWGDYSYSIPRFSSVTLQEIFTALGITGITAENDVQSISASDDSILQIDGLTVKNLTLFEQPQTLTITLKSGISGSIKVELLPLTESDDLNQFTDDQTSYSYEGDTRSYPLTEAAALKEGDHLSLSLSFSEVPDGTEGARQMALLEPMTYTFPAGLTVTDVPETIMFSSGNRNDNESFELSVTRSTDPDTGAQILELTGEFNDAQKEAIRALSAVSFTIPVTVQVTAVPGEYELGNGLVLSAVSPKNAKVTIASGEYDAETDTIQYTVTVEAEGDLTVEGIDYPVVITDLSAGNTPAVSFVSGSYLYTHKEGFDPEHASKVNGEDAVIGTETAFTGLPVTVSQMYGGDVITLTYTAKPLKGTYIGNEQAEITNTATIDNHRNPYNIPTDDTASVSNTVAYHTLNREYLTLDGSWAYWRVTVNPSGYKINNGSDLKLADVFDDGVTGDAEQSIDYSSIKVTSEADISYDYSGSTGTFVIPDSTAVTITYRTRIKANPGDAKLFRGTARLTDQDGTVIATATAGVTQEPVVIYPSPTDVDGPVNRYMLKLYVYADGAMQTGIAGATFILKDANQRAIEYKLGDNKGEPVTFTTGENGYVNIDLNEEPGDVSIQKNTAYYLEMMQALPGYQKDNTLYSFMITDDPDYDAGGFYTYYNGDTMKVRLYPAEPGLSVSIRFSGSYSLRDDQKNAVVAILQKKDDHNNWVEVERHPYTDTRWGSITFNEVLYDENLGVYQNVYRVVEENQSPWDLPEDINLTTHYYSMVNAAEAMPYTEPQDFSVDKASDSVSVVIDNRYEESQLTIVKMNKSTGEALPDAEFSVYQILNGQQTGEPVKTYTTDSEGTIVVRGGESFESETLYGIKETAAPDGYLLPQHEEWQYFYFCNDPYLEPSILANLPEGATAVNLTNSGDKVTVDNQKEIIDIPIMKLWQGGTWPENAEVVIGLYRRIEGEEEDQPVLNPDDSAPMTKTLTQAIPYNTFTGLYSRDEQDRNYIYSIKEESINGIDPLDAGYVQEYGISSAGVYIVRNKPATSLTVRKEWYDFSGNRIEDETLLREQSPVTFDVYQSSVAFTDSTTEDGVTYEDLAAFTESCEKVREHLTFGMDDGWTMMIRDLDQQDDLGNRYYYYALEDIPSFGTELYVLDDENGIITIQNQIAPENVNLTVTKAALVEDPRPESLDRDFEFTLKLTANGHPVRSWQVYTDLEHPENNLVTDWNGEVKFTLKPTNPDQQPTEGASITLSVPVGVNASVTETANPEYTVETAATVSGETGDNGRTFSYGTDSEVPEVTLTYTNTLRVICKVIDDNNNQTPFESLKSALRFIHDHAGSFTSPWTIYLLEDYEIPATDVVTVQEGESLIITTASTQDSMFPFRPGEEEDRGVIKRGAVSGSLFTNNGTLTLENIILDGNKDNFTAEGDGGLVNSNGTLHLNQDTVLRNSAASGKGGAVCAAGSVYIAASGIEITGNSAPSASALYLNGTLTMTTGIIKGNTGARDGAVVVEAATDRINLNGNPVIFGNTDAQGKNANLYIGADSDNILNVVTPGLTADAQIGVTAMEGHMLIGEQFATAEFEQTANLKCFVNDAYGYRGKLKDGTSTNIVWDGLTITIKKEYEGRGASANDRFTITLSSSSIIMSSYIIDGTLDYTVTAARQGRPGRIVFRNVKADDVISISPLPVGEYTIAEEASNYTPTYTGNETGSETPVTIEGGVFTAENDSTITVTNTRRLAQVNFTKILEDRLKSETETQEFAFTVSLHEADGTAVSGFKLAEGITTNDNGDASFTMSPSNSADDEKVFTAPVGVTMAIREKNDLNYRVIVEAKTLENAAISNLAEESSEQDTVFTFQVSDDGAAIKFTNERKMANIALQKRLINKVSETESFTFTITLTRADGNPAAGYTMYKDEEDPSKNITTDTAGKAAIKFDFGKGESFKDIQLDIPDGTKLEVAETDVNGHPDFYDTTYSINNGTAQPGTKATINTVSDSDSSIAFTNTRKTKTIVVKNTVNGYSGNVVPFTYTATVTDWNSEEPKPENYDDYNANDFINGVMTFELTTGQTQTLTVPYGAELTVAEGFIVGYGTTVKRGSAAAVEKLSDTFTVTRDTDMPASSPLLFTNSQLIGLRIVNNTSSKLENVTITVDKNNIYLVNEDQTGQERISTNKTATISVDAGKTAILEIQHDTSVTASQSYSVKGTTPAVGYYYTINNEPSFHETANPAILRVYNASNYEVKGELRYSVQDSTVTFTEQPLVSFDSNGGFWTTEMEGYKDRDGDRRVYQKPVTSGEKVARPSPDPVYPTAEEIGFLGWTVDEDFANASHAAGEDISAKAYDFENTPVTEPITLYAVWAKPARDERVVTVKNGTAEIMDVTVTLTKNGSPVSRHVIYTDPQNPDSKITTNDNGIATIGIPAGESRNLTVPDQVNAVFSVENETLAVSSQYELIASDDNKSYTIASVNRDGTVTFIPGVCKITDAAGNVLYDNNGKTAVYATLSAAFTAYGGTLYTDASHTTAGTQAYVKMLVDEYTITETVPITFPSKPMTFTTAGKDDDDFPYVGSRTRSAIYRSMEGANNNCFIAGAGNTTLTDIILDGGSEYGVKIAKAKNGGLIYMNNDAGILNVTEGATLRNCEFAVYDDGNNSRGGAIYMTKGTLNVDAGLFSNLHAYQGGAICVTGGTMNVTGTAGSTKFEDCSSEKQDGGAIYYNRAKDVVIDGGTDKDNPGIIFTRCVAAYTNGTGDGSDGGAIFATSNYTNTVTVKGCSFVECSARTGNKESTSGYGGGGICAYKVKGLTVEACTFEDCDTLCGGGAIAAIVKYTETVENETVTVKNSDFNRCNCKGQAGALGVYQDNNGATNSATKLSVIDSTFDHCSSGTNNGSGGAIQCYLPCMEFSGSTFTDCWAGKEGGAVNNFFGSNYTAVWGKSSMTVTNCRFIRCRAEDRYDTSAVQHYGGGINTKAKTVTVTGSYFEDCVSTLREGGALHIGGQGGGSKATITGSTFKNCSAKNGGGAVLSSHETLEISTSNFYGCSSSASNGGAVYHTRNSRGDSEQGTTTITESIFGIDPKDEGSLGCSAVQNGGAIWTRAATYSITDCTINNCSANNGGAIYLDNEKTAGQSGTITDGSIIDCQAVKGSAIYVENKATFSGELNVSGNTVSDINDGAIHGGKLYFEGNVKVENNSCSADSTYNHDVLMQNNNATTIYTTSNGLEEMANIGVYVPDSVFNNRGLEGKAFGTYDNGEGSSGSNYLDAFFNNRDSELYGYQASTTDTNIYWGIYICKITDEEGNTLKRTNGRDAIYPRINLALEEFNTVTGGKPVYVKMLIENYNLGQTAQIENFPDANITLTTETHTDKKPVEGEYDGKHPYRGKEGTFCTISRTNSTNQLFKLNNENATFQLRNITLDGRKDKTTEKGNFRLIEVASGNLFINRGTTMQYGAASNGGAIEAAADAQVTINGEYDADTKEPTVRFINCTVTGNKPNGGAIRAYDLTIKNSSNNKGEYGTAFISCSAYNGGAITSLGSSMEINGVYFEDCHTTSAGGAIYHNNSAADTTTTVKNSAFENCRTNGNNWAHGGAIEARTAVLNVEDCSFNDCQATSDGGAVYHGFVDGNNKPSGNRDKTLIKNTSFTGCATSGTDTGYNYGGSVYTQAKTAEVIDSSFLNSTATNHGGALYCQTSVADSDVIIYGTRFLNCSTSRNGGNGGAIYTNSKALTLQKNGTAETTISSCSAPGYSGAVHMANSGSVLNVKDGTVISNCYANKGGAIYLLSDVTMNLTESPEFRENGYTTQSGSIVDAEAGACIYLSEGSRINLSGSPKFSRNILSNQPRITNGGITDFVRQDIYLAGYAGTSATSIYVVGELTGDTIWVWPEQSPHRLPNEQFAKIDDEVTVSDETLSHLRNSLADNVTHCEYGEYLAGVQLGEGNKNVYWDKMYTVSFKKIDNKGVTVPGAGFTFYKDMACKEVVGSADSADGETDTDAQGKLLPRGTVEFTSIRIGAYYMKETGVPTSFKENDATYIVLVGTPYLAPNDDNRYLWENGGPLDVPDAATLVARHTTDAGKYYGIFPLDENNKAVLRANLASNSVGIVNIRNDYQVSFMKTDSDGKALPGAAFTIYTQILDSEGNPAAFEDGYPELMLWSRDGETYPAPVVSADGTAAYKDVNNNTLPKGMVYFRELPLGTYYLLETDYPERNGDGRRTYYAESDRVFRLTVEEDTESPDNIKSTLSEWVPSTDGTQRYDEIEKTEGYYTVSNNEVVCKLTDADNNLLYTEGHAIRENKSSTATTRLFPAVYGTLEEGFNSAQNGTFVYKDRTAAVAGELKLKVLKDFTISRPVTYISERKITFTTAETTRTKDDRYIFSTTRTTDTSRALIRRSYSEDGSANANDGALITLSRGADMTLQNIRLNGQKTNYNGRAIHVTDGSSLTIQSHTQIENFRQEAAADSAGESDLKGGAVLLEDNTNLTIDGGYNRTAIFTGNEVVNHRTAGNTGSDGGAIAVGADCTFRITNAQFSSNRAVSDAEKKGNGGAVSINKTKEAADQLDLEIYNVVFTGNSASYKGGAVRTAENCNLTVNNCTFSSNTAVNEGGAIAVLSKAETPSSLTITNGTTFTGNTAASGGAVRIGGNGTLNLNHVTMRNNSATENGGAVSAAPAAVVTFTSGTIAGNTAVLGSALYAEDGASVTITNASITGNTASGTIGGAINIGGNNARLYFGGNPTVFDNFGEGDNVQQKNLILSEDTNAIINTTEDGLQGGIIGVYVIEDNGSVFEEHGLPGKPFGTFGDAGHLKPEVFRNDHSLALYGVKKDSDNNIYWVDVLCKLTDANDNILYQDIRLTINGETQIRKGQAVYARITTADGGTAEDGFNVLLNGFEVAQNTGTSANRLYSRNGTSFSVIANSDPIRLKMLKDYNLEKSIVHTGSTRSVTFTTAEQYADLTDAMKARGDYFSYSTDRTDGNGNPETSALISRAFNGDSMITASGQNLTIAGIILDGARTSYQSTANGGIVHVSTNGILTVTDGAVLRNSITTGNGAGIWLEWTDAENHAVLNLSGNPSFGGTDRVGGEGTDKDNLKGTEGNFVRKDARFKTGDTEPANGGKQYPKENNTSYYLVRQDIYISGTPITPIDTAKPHSAIHVTGNLISGDGTIWVWADNVNHYEMLKQFAMFSEGGTGLSDVEKDTSMRAFRNAQPDSVTNCGGDYLTGQKGEVKDWIYWTGGFDVVFVKTDSFGVGLPGVEFTLYSDEACTTPFEMTFTGSTPATGDGKRATTVSSDGTATYKDKNGNTVTLVKGEVLLAKVPPKTFYLKETSVPDGFNRVENSQGTNQEINKNQVYQVNVLGTGEFTIKKKGTDGQYSEEVYKEKRREVTVNGQTTDLIQYVILNIPEAERKVVLRKIHLEGEGEDKEHLSLEGATFEVLRYDRTPVKSTNSEGETVTEFTSGASGVYFIDTLPYGLYYLHEKSVPSGYQTITADKDGTKDGNWFILIVNKNGAGYITKPVQGIPDYENGTPLYTITAPETVKP
ncbi:MAG: leucine-rich repeat protein [Solobacterium sp.]|nr:leucine-rich repeat protein [Solobacterium sp.]